MHAIYSIYTACAIQYESEKMVTFLFSSVLSNGPVACTEKRKLNRMGHDDRQVMEGVVDYPDHS